MRGERQMNKNSQRLEDGASGSPYVNRCGEYTIEVEFAGSSSLESCIAAYLNMPRVRLQDEGGRTVQRYVKDYRITQDMAKKLCKLHHTAVGAAYHPQPFDWDALLRLLHKKPPRRSSYEAQLSDSDSLVTTTQIAKEYGCGAKVFNRLLHLHGIQYRANGQWVLYSEHHGKGYTSSLTFRLQRSDGSEVEKLHTAWTQKGRKFLYHTLKRRGVLPLAEQGG